MAVVQNDIIRVTAQMSYGVGGQQLINVLHVLQLDAVSIPDPTALTDLGLMLEVFYTPLLASQSDRIQYIDYTAQNITQDILLGSATWPTFVAGGSPSGVISPQVALLIYFPTNKPNVQGRLFYPGIPETGVTDGIWTAGVQAAMASMGALMLSPYIASTGRYLYQVVNRVLKTNTNPTSAVVRAGARTQRRRSIGFGS